MSDRTNWRAMLKGNAAPLDMAAERDRLVSCVQSELANLAEQEGPSNMTLLDEPAITIDYPVQVWPKKVSSHNFDKSEVVSGKLEGIKGQYLLLSNGVINLRKFTSYYVSLNVL